MSDSWMDDYYSMWLYDNDLYTQANDELAKEIHG